MTRLRIVHAVRSDGFAGVERYVSLLARTQAADGHEVRVVGGDPAQMAHELLASKIPQAAAATVVETARALDAWRAADILHLHMTAAEIAAVLAVRTWRVPAVCTRHFAQPRGTTWAGRTVGRWAVHRRIDAQIAVSQAVAETIDGPSTVVWPGVDAPAVVRSAAERERIVLIAQRLEPEKDTAVGLRAFAVSGLAGEGWRLRVAGVGSQRACLEAEAARLSIAHAIDFLGRRSDMAELMASASMLLAPCPHEHFGLSVVEAMGAGLPVVAVGAVGHLESVGLAEGAALFAAGGHEQAAALLAGLGRDADRRDIYAANLREIQRTHFTPRQQADGVEAVYRSVL